MFAEMPLDNLNGRQIRGRLPPSLASSGRLASTKRLNVSSWLTVL
jgi:hypothetical protein